MTEHVHKWCWAPWWENGPAGRKHFMCEHKGCEEELSLVDAERRLNATERLSASKADTAASLIRGHTVKHDLKAYAKALEPE